MNLIRPNYLLIAASRILSLATNLVVVFVVSTHLTPIEQGYYYAFQSLGAAQFFFDLGVGFVLANIAGRKIAEKGVSDVVSQSSALRGLFAFALKWSALSGFALVVVLMLIGSFMFPSTLDNIASLRLVWLAYVALVALNMGMNTLLSILEGVGQALSVSAVRAGQAAAFVVILYISSSAGFGLTSLPMALCGSSLLVLGWLFARLIPVFSKAHSQSALVEPVSWSLDIMRFQWRVAASWIAGYFVFQAPVPYLFKTVGVVEAGRLGLTMQIFQALTTLASILLTTRISTWTRLAVNRSFDALSRDLWFVAKLSVVAVALGAGFFVAINALALQLIPGYVNRLIDIDRMVWLSVAAMGNQLFFCLNYYFRAQGKEPLWTAAVLAGAISVVVGFVLVTHMSVDVAVITYTLISILIHCGGSLLIYFVYRASGHVHAIS